MKVLQKMIILSGFLFVCLFANAQVTRNIETIFRDYGKQKGSILIELGKDVLGEHTKIKWYKSLIIPFDSLIVNSSREAIRKDLENGSILKETGKNGKIETGYYCFQKETGSPDYEYILFSNKSGKMTLIYLKGNFPPNRLENEMNELKNLFIKINNK